MQHKDKNKKDKRLREGNNYNALKSGKREDQGRRGW